MGARWRTYLGGAVFALVGAGEQVERLRDAGHRSLWALIDIDAP